MIDNFKSKADIDGVSYLKVREAVIAKVTDLGFNYEEAQQEAKVSVKLSVSEISFFKKDQGVGLALCASNLSTLCTIKEFVHKRLLEGMPEAAAALTWLDGQKEGDLPVNFRFATVVSSKKLGNHFIRVRLAAQNLADFDQEQSHFSFILAQPDDTSPQWPYVDEKGRVVWPKNEKTLHRSVYTIRQIDVAQGWFDVDIFVNKSGRTYQWALKATPGDIVGITGPTGRLLPKYNHKMLIAADETGYPSVARLLSSLPESCHGDIVLVGNGTIDYPMPSHCNFQVQHIDRTADKAAFVSCLQTIAVDVNTQVWLASQSKEVRAIRDYYRNEIGITKANSYMAGFWAHKEGALA